MSISTSWPQPFATSSRRAAKAISSEAPHDGELRYGAAWEPLQRLRQVLVTDQHKADFTAVVADLASTLAHSLLVSLDGGTALSNDGKDGGTALSNDGKDGGTALSNDGKRVFLADRNGEEIADVLHERLFDHLDFEEAVRTALS